MESAKEKPRLLQDTEEFAKKRNLSLNLTPLRKNQNLSQMRSPSPSILDDYLNQSYLVSQFRSPIASPSLFQSTE